MDGDDPKKFEAGLSYSDAQRAFITSTFLTGWAKLLQDFDYHKLSPVEFEMLASVASRDLAEKCGHPQEAINMTEMLNDAENDYPRARGTLIGYIRAIEQDGTWARMPMPGNAKEKTLRMTDAGLAKWARFCDGFLALIEGAASAIQKTTPTPEPRSTVTRYTNWFLENMGRAACVVGGFGAALALALAFSNAEANDQLYYQPPYGEVSSFHVEPTPNFQSILTAEMLKRARKISVPDSLIGSDFWSMPNIVMSEEIQLPAIWQDSGYRFLEKYRPKPAQDTDEAVTYHRLMELMRDLKANTAEGAAAEIIARYNVLDKSRPHAGQQTWEDFNVPMGGYRFLDTYRPQAGVPYIDSFSN